MAAVHTKIGLPWRAGTAARVTRGQRMTAKAKGRVTASDRRKIRETRDYLRSLPPPLRLAVLRELQARRNRQLH